MPTLSRMISNAVETLISRPVTITGVEAVSDSYRLTRMQGIGFEGVKWLPGQAVQIYLGNFNKRSYTLMSFDQDAGSASLLFYLHGKGPGSEWAASAKAGSICLVMRPKNSIDLSSVAEPALFFGDETSFAAAQVLHGCRKQALPSRFIFEVDAPAKAQAVLRNLGMPFALLVQKRADGAHLPDVVAAIAEQAARIPSQQWIFTGQARSIQNIQKGLKQVGVSLLGSKVKAYWSAGKTGLD